MTKTDLSKSKEEPEGVCPTCGTCPTCGAKKQEAAPVQYVPYPVYPQPWVNPYAYPYTQPYPYRWVLQPNGSYTVINGTTTVTTPTNVYQTSGESWSTGPAGYSGTICADQGQTVVTYNV
jgi:hypothetical protein